ncbi:chromosome transmission fidelity protein 8 homolog [Culicoides brevitarsis]|uniref:chromosome transmission fidelity protein 8 homolog n=1 Tax=Culicoides brevitarsis TaxID=469753 RepID=UPI00307C36B6
MPIIVETPNPDTGLPEWVIIELQGDLETRNNDSMEGEFIGDLMYSKFGQPILIIGHHILHGKEQKIEKPFAVLERIRKPLKTTEPNPNETVESLLNATEHNDSTMLDCTVAIEHKTKVRTGLFVRAIVKKKLIFKARPKPIIANVAKTV